MSKSDIFFARKQEFLTHIRKKANDFTRLNCHNIFLQFLILVLYPNLYKISDFFIGQYSLFFFLLNCCLAPLIPTIEKSDTYLANEEHTLFLSLRYMRIKHEQNEK